MTRSLIFAMLFAALPVVLPAAAQDLEVSPVAGSIHMISGQGGNIGVSTGADGFLMVDDKFAPLADQIRAQLEGLGEGELNFSSIPIFTATTPAAMRCSASNSDHRPP